MAAIVEDAERQASVAMAATAAKLYAGHRCSYGRRRRQHAPQWMIGSLQI